MPVGKTDEIERERRRRISEALKGRPKGKRKPRAAESRRRASEASRAMWASRPQDLREQVAQKIRIAAFRAQHPDVEFPIVVRAGIGAQELSA